MITNGLPPVHPGEILREILEDLSLTQTAFANAIGVSSMRVSHVLKGAHRSPQNWLCVLVALLDKHRNIG